MSGFVTTPNYNLRKPVVGGDNDAWGNDLNFNADTLDTQLKARADAQALYIPLIGGTATGTINAPTFALTAVGDALTGGSAADYYVWTDQYGFAAAHWNAAGWTFDYPVTVNGDVSVTGNMTLVGSFSPGSVATDHVTFPRDVTLTDAVIPGAGIVYADQYGFGVPICDDHGIVNVPLPSTYEIARWDDMLTCARHTPGTATGTANDMTFSQVMELESPFTCFRLIVPNNSLGNVVIRAAVAPSAKYNDGINPVDAANNPVAWTSVTWGNGGKDVDLWTQLDNAMTTPPPADFTLLPRPSWATTSTAGKNAMSTLYIDNLSDWVQLASIPRADSTSGRPLLFMRVYATPTSAIPTPFGGFGLTGNPSSTTGRIEMAFSQSGVDGVTTPTSFTSTTQIAQHMVRGVQAIHMQRGLCSINYSDSVLDGQGNGGYGFAEMVALALSTPSQPFTVWMTGHTGSCPNVHGREASYAFSWAKPAVAYIQTFSRANAEDNAFTVFAQQTADEGLAKAMSFARRCIGERCVPILYTSPPWVSIPLAGDAIRQNINAKVRAAAQQGFLVVDLDVAFSIPGTPPTFNPTYTSDGFHMNAAGEAVAYNLTLPLVKKALLLP